MPPLRNRHASARGVLGTAIAPSLMKPPRSPRVSAANSRLRFRKVDAVNALCRLLMAAGLVAVAAVAGAQAPSGIVNSLVVKRLAATGTPEANQALAHHFAALADRYAADADQDRALASAFVGNPTRTFGNAIDVHYARAAESATEWARAARDMARYHQQRAAGEKPIAPALIAFFDSGGGAPAPTFAELQRLAMAARSPSEHHDLEEYYLAVASVEDAIARRHLAIARALRVASRQGTQGAVTHCDGLVVHARAAAAGARANATVQHQLASIE